MGRETPRVARRLVGRDDLAGLGPEKLADLLAEQISSLPYHEQKQWPARHLPGEHSCRSATEVRPAEVLKGIEAFCRLSRQGIYQSWVDEHEWDSGFDGSDEGDDFQEWVELFTDWMRDALTLTASGRHKEAATAYRLLLNLLKEAQENTVILQNHGAPEDVVPIDFSEVVGAYTEASRSRARAGIWTMSSTKSCRSQGDSGTLKASPAWLGRSTRATGCDSKRGCPEWSRQASRPTSGVVPKKWKVWSRWPKWSGTNRRSWRLKERFASRNARYFDDVLAHYKRAQNWASVARLAEVGIRSFTHHGEYAKALVKAREALGDPLAALEAEIAHFLDEQGAAAFATLRRKSQALSDWGTVFERLVQASASRSSGDPPIRLRMLLLLVEGRETEALAGVARWTGATGFDEIKFVAKYPVARMSDGVDLVGFKKLAELQRRVKRDKDEPYDWLRLVPQKPGTRSRDEYGRLAVDRVPAAHRFTPQLRQVFAGSACGPLRGDCR
jgi:hypothetical protein